MLNINPSSTMPVTVFFMSLLLRHRRKVLHEHAVDENVTVIKLKLYLQVCARFPMPITGVMILKPRLLHWQRP